MPYRPTRSRTKGGARGETRCAARRTKMTAHAGEKAEKTGDFRCEKCHRSTHVQAGHPIPKCPHCGNGTYGERTREPGNKQ
ncbi:zinc ribbon-containing protein [Burkholderia orbicola]